MNKIIHQNQIYFLGKKIKPALSQIVLWVHNTNNFYNCKLFF